MPRRALILGTAAAVLLGLAPAAAGAATTDVEFTTAGEHAFTVPDGVIQLQVALTGAHGGGSALNHGGAGATVAGTLAVQAGQQLYAEVGGAGANGSLSSGVVVAGGVNGGGSGAAGGGGASDIRTTPAAAVRSFGSRLAVAAGGGGASFSGGFVIADGADGGAADAAGGDAGGGQGGRPGTGATGGAGGLAGFNGSAGGAGGFGTGGNGAGPNFGGGGGGGGYYGGGGGGGMGPCNPCRSLGGGGGGSSLVPDGWTQAKAAPTDDARVRISYELPTARLSATALTFAETAGAVSPAQTLTLTNDAARTRLIVSRVTAASDDFFVAWTSCDGSLRPAESCAVKVRYSPERAGWSDSRLAIESNAGPFTVDLHGTATEPPVQTGTIAAPRPAGVKLDTCRVHGRRCTVHFAGAVPAVHERARLAARLTRGGATYARVTRTVKRGPLRLTLTGRHALKPGRYTLRLDLGAVRLTRPVLVG